MTLPRLLLSLMLSLTATTARAQYAASEPATGAEALDAPAPRAEESAADVPQPAAPAAVEHVHEHEHAEEAAPPPAVPPAPAPPPGYVYPTPQGSYPAPGTLPSETETRIEAIDARLAELDQARRQYSLAGPIATMAGGFGVTAMSLTIIAVANDGYTFPDADVRNLSIAFGAVGALGLGVGLGGLSWLRERNQQRSVHDPEIRTLREQRRVLIEQLQYQLYYGPGGPRAGLTLRF